MRRFVRVAATGAALLAPPVAAAAPVRPEAVPPPAIVVTGSALAQTDSAKALGQLMLDRQALGREPSGRLEALLRGVAGFQQFRRSDSRSANPTSQGVTFRGIGGNAASRALVLLDGVPQADAFAGWIAWPSLEPSRLSAIRVTRGTGAAAFAPGALTGTIELMSADARGGDLLDAGTRYGSRDSLALGASATSRLGRGFASVGASFERGDGHYLLPAGQRGPADIRARYEQWSAAVRGVAPVGDTAELQARVAGFSDDRVRGLAFAGSTSEGGDASLRLVSAGDWGIEALAYLQMRRFTAGFARVEDDRRASTPALDQYNTPATGIGAKVEVRPPLGAGMTLAAGLDARHSSGETRERFSWATGSGFTRLREAGGRSLTTGAFLDASWTVAAPLTLSAAARLDRWTIGNGHLVERTAGAGTLLTDTRYADRAGWEPTLRGGALWRLTPAVHLRTSVYTGFRLPTLNELYRPYRVGADVVAANAALRPERLKGVEAGVDLLPLPSVRASLTLFWNRLEDAVANVTLARGPGTFPQVGFVSAAGSFSQRLNVGRVTARGVEASASVSPGPFQFSATYAYTDADVSASGVAAALDGRRPAQTPAHMASLSAGVAPADGPLAGADASVTLQYDGPRFEDDVGLLRLDDALTVGASVRLPVAAGLALTLAGENLLGERIESGVDGDGVLDLGTPRTLWVGLRVSR
jgi:vitamin B12 transporter